MKFFFIILLIIPACIKAGVGKENGHLPTINGQRSTITGQRPTITGQRSTINGLNRPAFYKAMQENNKILVNEQLTLLKSLPEEEGRAFLGAMLMKKSGLGGGPADKLHLFNEGHKMLETAIKQDSANAEYRFLRLMIQEHAPGILGYKNDIEKDCEFIRKSYKTLPDDVQQSITGYNKKSKVLKLGVS